MRILVTSNGLIAEIAHAFEFGAWEESDIVNGKPVHKWKAVDGNGNTMIYIIDENRGAMHGEAEPTCKVYEVESLPGDFTEGKYLYIAGEFVENPEYTEPPKSDSERIADLEAQLDAMADAIREGVNEV